MPHNKRVCDVSIGLSIAARGGGVVKTQVYRLRLLPCVSSEWHLQYGYVPRRPLFSPSNFACYFIAYMNSCALMIPSISRRRLCACLARLHFIAIVGLSCPKLSCALLILLCTASPVTFVMTCTCPRMNYRRVANGAGERPLRHAPHRRCHALG